MSAALLSGMALRPVLNHRHRREEGGRRTRRTLRTYHRRGDANIARVLNRNLRLVARIGNQAKVPRSATRLADPGGTGIAAGGATGEALVTRALGAGGAGATGGGADHGRCVVALASVVAEAGAAAAAIVAPVAGRVAGAAIVDAGRRPARLRGLAGAGATRHGGIGQATDQPVVAGPLHPTIAIASFTGAGRGGAIRRRGAGPRAARNRLSILTTDQTVIAGALHAAIAGASLTGTRWRRALALLLTGAGAPWNRLAVLATDETGVAGAEYPAVAVAADPGARRWRALILWLAGTGAARDRLSILAADQPGVAISLYPAVAGAPLPGARAGTGRGADEPALDGAADETLVAGTGIVVVALAPFTGAGWIAFRFGLADARSTWAGGGRLAADQPGVARALDTTVTVAPLTSARRRGRIVALATGIAVAVAAAGARFVRGAGIRAGITVGRASVRVAGLLGLADAGTAQEIGGRAADQAAVAWPPGAGRTDAALAGAGWRRCRRRGDGRGGRRR